MEEPAAKKRKKLSLKTRRQSTQKQEIKSPLHKFTSSKDLKDDKQNTSFFERKRITQPSDIRQYGSEKKENTQEMTELEQVQSILTQLRTSINIQWTPLPQIHCDNVDRSESKNDRAALRWTPLPKPCFKCLSRKPVKLEPLSPVKCTDIETKSTKDSGSKLRPQLTSNDIRGHNQSNNIKNLPTDNASKQSNIPIHIPREGASNHLSVITATNQNKPADKKIPVPSASELFLLGSDDSLFDDDDDDFFMAEQLPEETVSSDTKVAGNNAATTGGAVPEADDMLQSCPLCQTQFEKGMTQLDIDGHLAMCLSKTDNDL